MTSVMASVELDLCQPEPELEALDTQVMTLSLKTLVTQFRLRLTQLTRREMKRFGHRCEKICLRCVRTTKAQTSLRIRAD